MVLRRFKTLDNELMAAILDYPHWLFTDKFNFSLLHLSCTTEYFEMISSGCFPSEKLKWNLSFIAICTHSTVSNMFMNISNALTEHSLVSFACISKHRPISTMARLNRLATNSCFILFEVY